MGGQSVEGHLCHSSPSILQKQGQMELSASFSAHPAETLAWAFYKVTGERLDWSSKSGLLEGGSAQRFLVPALYF